VFLHPIGSTGHVMHSGAFGHEMSLHYYSSSGGTGIDLTESARTHYAELVFLHPVRSVGHVVHSSVSRA
jgi:hypothetical protein